MVLVTSCLCRLVGLSFLVLLLKAQEVHVRLEEEWMIDVAPECPRGSAALVLGNDQQHPLCVHSLFDEEKRRTMTEETRMQMQYVPSVEEEATLIDVSLLIHLGLNRRGAQEYNMTQISSRLLDLMASAEVHISFQEYFSLDIVSESQMEPDIMSPNTCPQGFETIIVGEDRVLIELSVCPFRQTYAMLLLRHPFLGKAQALSGIPLANYLDALSFISHSHLPCGLSDAHRGFQHILLDQEFISCVPCFPGAFCPRAQSLFLTPQLCPIGTYNGWYGKQTTKSCRACPQLPNASAVSIFQGCDHNNNNNNNTNGTSLAFFKSPTEREDTLQLVANSVRVTRTPKDSALDLYDAMDRQDSLQASISQWLAATITGVTAKQDASNLEIHVIFWEIFD